MRGGARPNSGPKKGAKYRPRSKKAKGSDGRAGGKKRDPQKQAPVVPADIVDEAKNAGMMPLDYMLKVMRSETATDERRDRMAQAAAPFCHARKGEGAGKKSEKEEAAKRAGSGKFAPSKAPIALVK